MIAPGLMTILKLAVALDVPPRDLLDPFTGETLAQMKLGARPAASEQQQSKAHKH